MDMDCEIIEEEDNRIRILLTGTDHASVNALRRTMIADTPKMAIHQVRFTQSTEITDDGTVWETVGPIPDEVIAHRLAMTPIPSDTQDFSFEHECINCKDMVESQRGCPLCNIVYTCNVKGAPEGVAVKARDLEVFGDLSLSIPEEFADITITKLYMGQMISLTAKAKKGYGRDHVKWQPVCGITFQSRQHAVLHDKKAAKSLWGLGLTVTEKDFGKDGRIEDIQMVEKVRADLHHVGPSTDLGRDFGDAITLEDVDGEFILSYETDGSMKARTVFELATASLGERFDSLSGDLDIVL